MSETSVKPVGVFIIHGTKSPWFLGEKGHKLLEWVSRTLRRRTGKKYSDDQFSWIDEKIEGEFANKLKDQLRDLSPIKIIPWVWSGLNRDEVREEEARKLAKRLVEIQNTQSHQAEIEGVVLVAHSHGGNIALRALQLLETKEGILKSQEGIRGLIFLATPFLQTLPRDPEPIAWSISQRKGLMSGLALCLGLCAPFILILTISHAVTKFFDIPSQVGTLTWPELGLLFALGLGGLTLFFFRKNPHDLTTLLKDVDSAQERIIDLKYKNRQIVPPCLCLHSLADEAAWGLGFSKFVTSIPYVLRNRIFGDIVVFFGTLFISLFWLKSDWGSSIREGEHYFFLVVVALILMLAIYQIVEYITVRIAGLISGLLFTFGSNPKDQFYVRTEVTLTPLYALHSEFKPIPIKETSLRHSIYKDPQVYPPIVEWWEKYCTSTSTENS